MLTALFITSLTGCGKGDSTITDNIATSIKSDSYDLIKDEDQNITLTVESESIPTLFEDGKELGAMQDNGDGTYSYTLNKKGIVGTNYHFTAKVNDKIIGSISIGTYDTITQEDLDNTMVTLDDVESKTSAFKSNGYISPDKKDEAINTIYEELVQRKDEAAITQVFKDTYGVTAQFANGIWYVYNPPIEGTKGAEEDINLSFYTAQPFNTTGDSLPTEKTDEIAQTVSDRLNNVEFKWNYDDNAVNWKALGMIGSNEIILWDGHGGYSETKGEFITTGMDYVEKDLERLKRFTNGSLVITEGNRIGFTGTFVRDIFKNMSNSIIYMAACYSNKTGSLANAFLDNGAAAYIGYSDPVLSSYDRKLYTGLFDRMSQLNEETGDYYTIHEAFVETLNEIGATDENGTYPKLVGDYDYRIAHYGLSDGEYDLQTYYKANAKGLGITNIYVEDGWLHMTGSFQRIADKFSGYYIVEAATRKGDMISGMFTYDDVTYTANDIKIKLAEDYGIFKLVDSMAEGELSEGDAGIDVYAKEVLSDEFNSDMEIQTSEKAICPINMMLSIEDGKVDYIRYQ